MRRERRREGAWDRMKARIQRSELARVGRDWERASMMVGTQDGDSSRSGLMRMGEARSMERRGSPAAFWTPGSKSGPAGAGGAKTISKRSRARARSDSEGGRVEADPGPRWAGGSGRRNAEDGMEAMGLHGVPSDVWKNRMKMPDA